MFEKYDYRILEWVYTFNIKSWNYMIDNIVGWMANGMTLIWLMGWQQVIEYASEFGKVREGMNTC